MNDELNKANIITIKIGSSLLVKDHALDDDWLAGLVADIARLRREGKKFIIVSSGAVALGRAQLGFTDKELTLEESQACAAVGQVALAQGWQNALAKAELEAAQILLTFEDTEQRRRYLNARSTLSTLLDLGVIPIINENDTVATAELRYGDNDRLAARVAAMISADCLVLLSDVDGLYKTADLRGEDHIVQIDEITPEIVAMAGAAGKLGKGGMKTKLEAAQIARQAGCHTIITSGKSPAPLTKYQNGDMRATLFPAAGQAQSQRKLWISGNLKPKGYIYIDAGALEALQKGRSLLPVGVVKTSGRFDRGDCVCIMDADENEIARGLIAFNHADTKQIIGQSGKAVKDILGIEGRYELIHRDDLVMVNKGETNETT